jgi:hypothetical protein
MHVCTCVSLKWALLSHCCEPPHILVHASVQCIAISNALAPRTMRLCLLLTFVAVLLRLCTATVFVLHHSPSTQQCGLSTYEMPHSSLLGVDTGVLLQATAHTYTYVATYWPHRSGMRSPAAACRLHPHVRPFHPHLRFLPNSCTNNAVTYLCTGIMCCFNSGAHCSIVQPPCTASGPSCELSTYSATPHSSLLGINKCCATAGCGSHGDAASGAQLAISIHMCAPCQTAAQMLCHVAVHCWHYARVISGAHRCTVHA